MATRMLIDARHPEETRVAVLKGNRIEEFDFESAEHKQIKGNIYLAKVTRVEPSLQAAFVDFGGNRHGFLAFSEIHPDYYQIPAEDRAQLLAEEQAAAEEEAALRAAEDEDEEDLDVGDDGDDEDEGPGVEEIDTSEKDDVATIEDGQLENGEDEDESDEDEESEEEDGEDGESEDDAKPARSRRGRGRARGRRQGGGRRGGGSRAKEIDDVRAKRQALRRRYKIQDVIQRRQVLLVQVVKEERGNKGAALTTYLSLAGRYCVLMPNSSHGGGISRKISNGSDRKRLKQIVNELSLPKSMGLIVRTAGLQRNKTEIKRDFDYLARLWDEIRENTLKSSAPALIHSDSDLIKRAIRDIYNREIEEVVVEGEEGYRSAKDFMKLLMPSHARRVKAYSDPVPLFQRYGAEDQLSAMYEPVVQLKSGGYLVINPTEALVSIDINSGRSTKEHGIEQTALHTNLEAAKEIARQLRLRDMAGLVVIDFIDMEHNSNIRKVERCMKDSLRNDRARIQVGRISGFGLMEMSRQRLRTGVLEATTRSCPHCDGTGLVRTASSAGLSALRFIEDEAAKGKGTVITLYASTEASVYLLNAKRSDLAEIESRYGVTVQVVPEGEDEGAKMRVTSSGPRPTEAPKFEPIVDEDEDEADDAVDTSDDEDNDDDDGNDRKKRRRRRRGGRNRNRNRDREESDNDDEESSSGGDADAEASEDSEEELTEKPRRRRRGGRGRGRRRDEAAEGSKAEGEEAEASEADAETVKEEAPEAPAEAEAEEKPKRRTRRKKAADTDAATEEEAEKPAEEVEEKPKRRTRRKKADEPKADEPKTDEAKADDAKPEEAAEADAEVEKKPARKPRTRRKKADEVKEETAEEPAAETPAAEPANDANGAEVAETGDEAIGPDGEPRRGWWQRTFGQ
ncbi:Rne/Rng family ribonuclease [Alteraurantiacibacter aquimixticola]|uniref:Ribonuclease E n=1 Tax=Alteraurantiacibacter aquimixticola TaxID=2489173 RepID=A0A4T3F1R2_9SPHN|nr:ribonuclease E/G [Alteraurantiacibacter aquimixticola]TIX49970.1 ribonuclease E/G [Alteraurantiacibacter aquimixticola]